MVKQKTFLEVDELGTKAAAVIAVEGSVESIFVGPDEKIAIDRPYLFVLRDKATNGILFLGQIQHPEGGALPGPL